MKGQASPMFISVLTSSNRQNGKVYHYLYVFVSVQGCGWKYAVSRDEQGKPVVSYMRETAHVQAVHENGFVGTRIRRNPRNDRQFFLDCAAIIKTHLTVPVSTVNFYNREEFQQAERR